ncbi:hypothetical protein GBAR_LOCUS24998 [Geodia barretti]|uniref:Uncharacterized protein n=1 Tax=Geodia barretti TaxID=519541 RepID=A0AA35TBA8_GEOBA|nr:hypothetical protein GBAR_LOCUS24998 [Geodia barretti]
MDSRKREKMEKMEREGGSETEVVVFARALEASLAERQGALQQIGLSLAGISSLFHIPGVPFGGAPVPAAGTALPGPATPPLPPLPRGAAQTVCSPPGYQTQALKAAFTEQASVTVVQQDVSEFTHKLLEWIEIAFKTASGGSNM